MAKKFLIDVTDARFWIPGNEDVLAFIRRANPFAHSDVGSVLFALGKEIDGARAYCPSTASFAYVVLHTAADRIFAIAYGMNALAFRIAAPLQAAALDDGAELAPEIGAEWVRFEPWDRRRKGATHEWLRQWAQRALEQTIAATT